MITSMNMETPFSISGLGRKRVAVFHTRRAVVEGETELSRHMSGHLPLIAVGDREQWARAGALE